MYSKVLECLFGLACRFQECKCSRLKIITTGLRNSTEDLYGFEDSPLSLPFTHFRHEEMKSKFGDGLPLCMPSAYAVMLLHPDEERLDNCSLQEPSVRNQMRIKVGSFELLYLRPQARIFRSSTGSSRRQIPSIIDVNVCFREQRFRYLCLDPCL